MDEERKVRTGAPSKRQGSRSVLLGDYNERVILSTLRRLGPASKADLARRVGLTSNAAGVIVRKLEDSGLVRTVGKRYGGRGQPATILELDPEGAYSVGVRIDRDLVETVLVDFRGAILHRARLDALPEPAAAIAAVSDSVRRFRKALGPSRRSRIAGIGLATPYNLGSWLAELDLPGATLAAWDGFDAKSALAAATGLPVLLENDGSAAAVGEMIYGHGREHDDFLYLFVGPAIGGGVVLGGNSLSGRHANAGDVAVMPVGPSGLASGPPAPKGHLPLMARASLAALSRHLRSRGADLTSRNVAEAAAADPEGFAEWRRDAADALARPVLTSVHLLDIDHVVVAGDLAPVLLDSLIAQLQEALAAAVAESRRPPTVLAGAIGHDAGAIGAASLPLHVSFSPLTGVLTGDEPRIATEGSRTLMEVA
jgi:predicted NBD/HSP70 family sugar kinase